MSRTAICPRKTADSRKRTADRLATRPPRLLYCGAAKRPCGTALPYRGRRASSARWNLLPGRAGRFPSPRSEEHTSELQSRGHLVCRLLLEKKKIQIKSTIASD